MDVNCDTLIEALVDKTQEIVSRLEQTENMDPIVRLLESTRARTLMDVVDALKSQTNK